MKLTVLYIPYPLGNKTVLYQNWKERNPSYIKDCLIFYVGIRRFILKIFVLYSRSSYNKGRIVFQMIRYSLKSNARVQRIKSH